MANRKRCERTGKVRFRDDEEVKWVLERIRTDMGDVRAKKPVRWYENCKFCNGIHLTSQALAGECSTIWMDSDGLLHGFHALPDVYED